MSGIIIPTPAYKAVDWITFVTQVEYARKGQMAASLTNYDNTSLPAIASGSWAEVKGSIYKWTSEEAISGSPSSGVNYIYLVPSGSGSSAIVTATFNSTGPTWNDSLQGWYNSEVTARCVAYCKYDGASSYTEKRVYGGWRRKVREDHVDDDGKINTVSASCALKSAVTRYWSMGIKENDDSGVYQGISVPNNDAMLLNLHLPHGAIITSFIIDWDGTPASAYVKLYRRAYNSATRTEMASVSGDGTDSSISNATVDNSGYVYFMEAYQSSGSAARIHSIRITYTIDKVYMS